MEDIIDLVRAKLPLPDAVKWGPHGLQPPFGPGDPRDFEEDERAFGHALPPLLKRLYIEVGNGRFGPGYGLIGLTGGYLENGRSHAVQIGLQNHLSSIREDARFYWPAGYLPICHWGCDFYSVIDCKDPAFRMLAFSANEMDEKTGDGLFDQGMTFEAWITAWATGEDLWLALLRAVDAGYSLRQAAQQQRKAS